ncbi:hypothetical protein J4772_25505 [Cohnella sp. LGH]|uniref:hypothetical protein n=1 Tax=Cohnella sp. LGH TaxID=1619153 RepID=UPI001ADB05C5|nr:hypothetical protein [Cohnella sp. LGH]QTH40894.1 hypothetical protein J4772_25505 [Cohnella sp. LGH]
MSFDAINELSTVQQSRRFEAFLDVMSLEELKDLADVTEVILKDSTNKEQCKKDMSLISKERMLLTLLLRDFQNRKKRSIPTFYESNSNELRHKTPLAQLHHLFEQSPALLFSLLTYHLWTVRGTGDLLALDKNIGPGKARQVLTEKGFEDTLCNLLYKGSKETNKYRIFSYSIVGENRFICLMYKQVNDTSIPDYNQGIRHQEVNTLMFELNSESGTVEIKTKVQFEGTAIKKYIEETFEGVLSAYKTEVFQEFNKTTFIESVLNGKTASGKPVNDFLVEKVVFRSSPIKNSPEITLQSKNMDVWPSVIDASDKGCVNIESIKDLASIAFKSSGVGRTIRSIVKDDGHVVFTMDDSLIEKETLESIKTKFFEKFGVPMFQEIANNKFSDGQADLLDYVMGQRDHNKHSQGDTKVLYETLIKKKFLKNITEVYAECTNSDCPHETKIDDPTVVLSECPICDSPLGVRDNISTQIGVSEVRAEVKRKLRVWCADESWIMLGDSNLTFGNNTLKLIKLERAIDQRPLQILITEHTLDGRLLSKLYKMMNPLIVVFVGQQEKFIGKYTSECIQAISFGKLYVQKDDDLKLFFDSIYSNLELRAKNYLASAANKSYQSLCGIHCPPDSLDKAKYTPGDLEDDGYALLKDMFPNSVKWGKQQSGKQLPEGVFSLSYVRGDKERYAFSFDFKLSYKNEGYPLEIGEQRKAVQYVNDLNDSDLIISYAKHRKLSGHIFISNCFNTAQVETTLKYFEAQIPSSVITKPIFITTDVLTHLHLKYRENFEEVELAKNYYMHWLFEALVNKSHYVTRDHVDTIFKKLLTKQYREIDVMDMTLLTDEVTKKDAI